MRATRTRQVRAALLAAAVLFGLSLASTAATALVKTNAGDVLQGSLSGLAAMLRLEDPTPPVGPAAQFDIPLSSIQQIWVDFPRVVIETLDHVIVGPFSGFAGLAQLLRVEQFGAVTEIPFTAVRQIALNGEGFRPLPREWLGRNWLNQRLYVVEKRVATEGATAAATVATSASTALEAESVVIDTATEAETNEVVWNGAAPVVTTEAAPATSGELPWWVLLIGVAVLFAAFLLIPAGSGT